MKRIVILILIVFTGITGESQGLSDVFSQKSADLKSMGKQLALLQLYIGWIEKGYGIARSGLTFIGEMKQGELNLHTLFFKSLASINPAIRRTAKVASIIEYQRGIMDELEQIHLVKYLTMDEMNHLLTIKENLLKDCSVDLDNLSEVLSDQSYQMTDDERIIRIDGIYRDMGEKWVMAKTLAGEASFIAGQRQLDNREIQQLKNLE
jgi:hypothetical protein